MFNRCLLGKLHATQELKRNLSVTKDRKSTSIWFNKKKGKCSEVKWAVACLGPEVQGVIWPVTSFLSNFLRSAILLCSVLSKACLITVKLAATEPDLIPTHHKSRGREHLSPSIPRKYFEVHSNWPVETFQVTYQPWNPSLRPEGWNSLIGFF